MFQSIKYIVSKYNNETKLYHYHYEITDSDFICTSVVVAARRRRRAVPAAAAVIKEYESKKYDHKEIISNLFLLNMFLLKKWKLEDLNQILEHQHKYLTKKYYPESNFNEKYYDGLVKYTNKMMVIS